ncbi:MAG: membrane integrity-associated transporter subunit PqiC [Opitutae bacterium]|nr:membrane integrity-associated transporter subunit PqiC [Opitutae bacterium]
MKTTPGNLLRSLSSVLGLLALAGCSLPIEPAQPDTTRHFTLSSPVAGAPSGSLKVLPVRLAGHLQTRDLAVRVAENEVVYLEDARWAESPADGITALLRTRLAGVAAEGVVSVQVQRCEPVRSEGNRVELNATYTFQPAGGGAARSGVFTAAPRTWDGKKYGVLVGLLRDEVNELGDAIAAAVTEKK